jgi:hypothetical protein
LVYSRLLDSIHPALLRPSASLFFNDENILSAWPGLCFLPMKPKLLSLIPISVRFLISRHRKILILFPNFGKTYTFPEKCSGEIPRWKHWLHYIFCTRTAHALILCYSFRFLAHNKYLSIEGVPTDNNTIVGTIQCEATVQCLRMSF